MACKSTLRIVFLLSIHILTFVRGTLKVTRLGSFNINKSLVTLSGFSSGGTMAQQLYISYSSLFSGIAVFSHTFYRCGFPNGITAAYDRVCTKRGRLSEQDMYPLDLAFNDIAHYRSKDLIDDPVHLKDKKLYVFAGTRSYLFPTGRSLAVASLFEPFIKNKDRIFTHVARANLTLPSDRPDLPSCEGPGNSAMVANCGLSGALESLRFILPDVKIVKPHQKRSRLALRSLIQFDQTEFFSREQKNYMDSTGYIYVPHSCKDGRKECLLHIYFHGCSTGREFVGSKHILNSGFLEVAETNGLIVLFPQAISNSENSLGCWDTYGVTGKLYATKKGAQVAVVKRMLDRVLGFDNRPPSLLPPLLNPGFIQTSFTVAVGGLRRALGSLVPTGLSRLLRPFAAQGEMSIDGYELYT